MEAAGLVWISSLGLAPRAGPSGQWPSAKDARMPGGCASCPAPSLGPLK